MSHYLHVRFDVILNIILNGYDSMPKGTFLNAVRSLTMPIVWLSPSFQLMQPQTVGHADG